MRLEGSPSSMPLDVGADPWPSQATCPWSSSGPHRTLTPTNPVELRSKTLTPGSQLKFIALGFDSWRQADGPRDIRLADSRPELPPGESSVRAFPDLGWSRQFTLGNFTPMWRSFPQLGSSFPQRNRIHWLTMILTLTLYYGVSRMNCICYFFGLWPQGLGTAYPPLLASLDPKMGTRIWLDSEAVLKDESETAVVPGTRRGHFLCELSLFWGCQDASLLEPLIGSKFIIKK